MFEATPRDQVPVLHRGDSLNNIPVILPSLAYFPALALAFPESASQINYLHSNSCSRVWGLNPRQMTTQAKLLAQTVSPQLALKPDVLRPNMSGF